LEELGYDIIKYDAGDIRNKSIIENITLQNMSDRNVLSMFTSKVKPIAILMDEIDGMNNGDKGGINALIKLIRPKKNQKTKIKKIQRVIQSFVLEIIIWTKNKGVNESVYECRIKTTYRL